MTNELVTRSCRPCEGGVEPLSKEQGEELLQALHEDWSMTTDGLHIERTARFSDYGQTMGFANAVADIANSEDHHPVLTITYNTCHISYSTHSINGLSDNDFICAAKIDRLLPADEAAGL